VACLVPTDRKCQRGRTLYLMVVLTWLCIVHIEGLPEFRDDDLGQIVVAVDPDLGVLVEDLSRHGVLETE
jgi:hypothetical protein